MGRESSERGGGDVPGGSDQPGGADLPGGESSAARADAAIRAIASGANPAEEALTLSNRFTDDAMERLRARLHSLLRRKR